MEAAETQSVVARVLVTGHPYGDWIETILRAEGIEVMRGRPTTLGRIEPVYSGRPSELSSVEVVVVSHMDECTGAIIAAAPRLRGIVSAVIGLDNVDLAAADQRDLIVAHGAMEENYLGVAEATVMLIGALLLDLVGKQRALVTNAVEPGMRGRMVRGKVIGLVGFGRAARGVWERLRGWDVQVVADGPADPETHRAVREAKEAELGHKLAGRKPDPESRWGKKAKSPMANVTDPDSRVIKDGRRYVQGYNAQAAVTEDQVIVAAEMTNSASDSTIFGHMVRATEQNLSGAGAMRPGTFVADAGYWSGDNAGLECDAEILIAPMPATSDITDPDDPRLHQRQAIIEQLDRAEISIAEVAAELGVSKTWARKLLANHRRGGQDPVQIRAHMLERLHSSDGAAAFAKRGITVEPVFGNLKANLGYRRFSRRGFGAVASEWRLICTAHNLLKLHRHQPATG